MLEFFKFLGGCGLQNEVLLYAEIYGTYLCFHFFVQRAVYADGLQMSVATIVDVGVAGAVGTAGISVTAMVQHSSAAHTHTCQRPG
jgi:hypothetical protein